MSSRMRSIASAGAFIIMYSRPRASSTLRSMSTSGGDARIVVRGRRRVPTSTASEASSVAIGAQPVHAQRAAAGDEVDDGIGHAELRA